MHLQAYKSCACITQIMLKKRFHILFTETQLKQLKQESNQRGESVGNIVRLAVNDFFLKLEGCK